MAAISKASGISQGAVSSMVNGRNYGIRVSRDTQARVFRVCRELGYVPNDLRAIVRMYPEVGDTCILRSRKGHDLPSSRGFMPQIISALHNATAFSPDPISLACYDPLTDYRRDTAHLPRPIRAGVATKFLLVDVVNESLLSTLLDRNDAVVNLCPSAPQEDRVTTVRADYAAAPALALRHLQGLGHRRIAVLTNSNEPGPPCLAAMNASLEVVREELESEGCRISMVFDDLTTLSGSRFVDAIGSKRERPTAVLCLSEDAAAGVLSRAGTTGLRVPTDLSVVGCCLNDSFPAMLAPRLTAVQLPIEEMAEQAVHAVQALVEGGPGAKIVRTLLPPSLVVRESCARPPK